jgi:DNA-binding beta-propeller fold protein YncE/predicted nucleic acid-binding Zn ribbon protein
VVDGPPPAAGEEVVDGEQVAEETPEEEKRRRRKKALLLLLLGLLAMLITIAIWYLLFRQPVTPLPVIPESTLPGYATSVYGTNNPMGIASSKDGSRIYVADTEGERVVRVFDAGGTQVAVAKPPEATGGEHVPVWIAIDPLTEEVYVTDRPTGEIYIYNRDGVYQRTLTLAKPITGWQPTGIAFGADGLLYVVDLGGGAYPRVEVIDRTANVVRTIGETSQLNFPNGVAVDKDGNVYVADSNSGRLLVFGPDGTVRAQIGRGTGEGNLGLPRGVAIDEGGKVYVADSTGQGVFVYRALAADAQRLDFIGFFGGEGVADGRFEFPNGVAVDGRGRVYVADTVNDRFQVWSY